MFPKALICFGVPLCLVCALFNAGVQADDARLVSVKARIVKQSYCRADADLFTVSLKLAINIVNSAKEPIYIKKSMIPWVARVASTETDAKNSKFIFEITQSHYPQSNKLTDSVRVSPGKSFTLYTGYDFVARYNPAFSYAKSLGPGNYAIVLVLKPEMESPDQRENSNVIDSLTTEPFLLEVKQDHSVVDCGSSELRQERNKDNQPGLTGL